MAGHPREVEAARLPKLWLLLAVGTFRIAFELDANGDAIVFRHVCLRQKFDGFEIHRGPPMPVRGSALGGRALVAAAIHPRKVEMARLPGCCAGRPRGCLGFCFEQDTGHDAFVFRELGRSQVSDGFQVHVLLLSRTGDPGGPSGPRSLDGRSVQRWAAACSCAGGADMTQLTMVQSTL